MAKNISGTFVPNTLIFDVANVQSVDVKSPEFKELLVRLYQYINTMSLALNIKDTGLYDTDEYINGQVYFSNPALNSSTAQQPTLRQVVRKVLNWQANLVNGTTTIPHGIFVTSNTTFTRIYGVANNKTAFNYVPLPYASNTANQSIEMYVDATNVYIITASATYNGYNPSYVVLEYLQT